MDLCCERPHPEHRDSNKKTQNLRKWAYAAGVVNSQAAMLLYDRKILLETPAYFVSLDFDGDRVVAIHDFLYARYALAALTCPHSAGEVHL
jgi:hypothetical protein